MQKDQKELVPEMRFPAFSDKWLSTKLGKLLKPRSASRVHKEQWTESGVPFFRSSDVVANYKSLDNPRAYISKELFAELTQKSGRVKKNDILITGGGSIGIPYLVKTNNPLYFKDADLLWLKHNNKFDSQFLYYFLTTSHFRRFLKRITHIGTIAHYTIDQAKNTPISLPNLEEQQKISSFLSSVDEWIENLQKQKKALEKYKKGMMQKIFSQEIRFKDDCGNDFPEWKQIEVGEIFRVTRGNVLAVKKTRSAISNEYKYPVYSSQTQKDGLMGYYNDFLFEDAITWTTDGANAGEVRFRKGKFYCTNVCGVLISSEGYANETVATMLNNVTKKYVSYVGNPKLMNNVMSSVKLTIPQVQEQRKIAKLLSSLDNLIKSKENEISKAKEWKKGLLQQMFI